MLKRYLHKNQIPFVEFDTSTDFAKQFLTENNISSIPVFIAENTFVVGFDAEKKKIIDGMINGFLWNL